MRAPEVRSCQQLIYRESANPYPTSTPSLLTSPRYLAPACLPSLAPSAMPCLNLLLHPGWQVPSIPALPPTYAALPHSLPQGSRYYCAALGTILGPFPKAGGGPCWCDPARQTCFLFLLWVTSGPPAHPQKAISPCLYSS